jgi:autotransporter-associated beta strand protein
MTNPTPRLTFSRTILSAALVILASSSPLLRAANFVMSGNDGNGVSSFNTGTNWTGGAAPAPGNTYQTAGFVLRTPANSTAITFAGSSLEVQNGGDLRIKTSAAVTVTNLIVDAGGIVDVSATGSSLAGTMILTNGMGYISVGGAASFTCSSILSGPSGFNTFNAVSSAPAGTTILTSANSFSGGININGGTLQVSATGGGSTPLGSGTVTVDSSGTLVGGGGDSFGYSPHVAPANIFINGGTVTDLGTSSYRITMPNITFAGGTLTSAPGNAGDASGNYSFFGVGAPTVVTTLATNTTAVISAGKIALQQNGQATGITTFNVAAGSVSGGVTPGVDLLVSSPLGIWGTATSSVLKSGAGVMAFGGTNTYTGGTTISAGTLQLGTANDVANLNEPLGTGLVTNNASLSFASSQTVTVTNVVSGSGTLTVSSGTAILLGANTYSGGGTVTNGTLLANNSTGSGTGSGNVTVNNGGALGGSGTISGNVAVNSGGKTFPGNTAAGVTNTIGGSVTYNAGASASFHLSTSGLGSGNDQIVLSGASSVLTCGGVNVGILLTGPSLDQANEYVLFNLTGGGASIAGNFNATPVWLGSTPANASSYSIVPLTSKVVLHFTGSGTTNVPVVANLAASNIGFTNATLNGQLLSTGGQFPTVKIYYGPTDGGTNPAAWAGSISLGVQSGSFGGTISNLTANTTYHFASAASNSAGTGWATPSQSFSTLSLVAATVTNLPPSNVQGTSAILSGQVLSTGNQVPNVFLYYGTTDGGTNAGAWANNIYLGSQSGGFSATVIGLSTNTTYYFAAAAVNNAGTAWGRPSLTFTTLPTASVVSVLTYHNNNARTGANTNETLLTPATLNTNNFGQVIKYTVDGYLFAQPLYVANVAIPGQGTHNVVYAATEHDSIYAFDADNNAGANGGLIWSTNLGIAPLSNNGEFGGRYHNGVYIDLTPEVGITGTPVIDSVAGTLYVDVLTREVTATTNYYHRIHALNIATGAERPGSPVVVSATVPGTGVGGDGSTVPFVAKQEGQRPALTLASGKLYVAFGSFADTDPYHGWVMGFDATTLQQLTNYVFNSTPNATTAVFGGNAGEGALWMGGNGVCVDANTNLFFETANGSFSANTNGGDYADCFIKLTTSNLLAVADYFSPSNQASLASGDSDLGSGGPILLPDEVGSVAHPHLIVGGGKEGRVFLVDRDNMGHFNTGTNMIVEQFSSGAGSFFGTPVYFNYQLYYMGKGGVMKAFGITNGFITTPANSTSPTSFAGYGITPSISANGTSNGIVWVIQTDGSSPSDTGSAVLRAYNATNISQELYNSNQNGTRDNPGPGVKYTVPMIANGKVYVGTQYGLAVYGYTTFLATPTISPNGLAYTNSVVVTLADATPGAAIYYTLDGTTPTTNSTLYTGPITITTTVNLQAIAVKSGAANSGIASAAFINTAALGSGAGLTAQYWSNTTSAAFTNVAFNAAPTLTRTDAVVNFNWSTTGPDPSVGQSSFAVRWTGSVQPQYSETYTFTTIADDGVRLWVNGQLLINDWNTHTSAATNTGTISLNAQQLYTIRIDYFQNVNNAVAQLHWSSPSTAQSIVPQTQLYSYTNPPPTIVLSTPSNGATYTAAASVSVGANADAPYNPIARVDFYANGSLIGTLTNSPLAPLYAVTTTGLSAGGYMLTAVAIDGSGLANTSAPVSVTVGAGSGAPYGLTSNGTVKAFLNMPTTFTGSLPPLLSETGAYTNTPNRTPSGGLIPYVPNTPLWSDGAVKSRYMAVPNHGTPLTPDEQIAFLPTNTWTFPAGTVFVKNFDLVVNETNSSAPLRRLETRLLVRDIDGAVYGVTYKWRADNSEADLLASSLNEDILITNATGIRTQTWYYPSPGDCLTCHTPVANYVLGANTRQLNNNQTYPATGVTDNQLRALNRLGLFYPAINEANISGYDQLSALTNLSASLEQRARSYLDANCAQCHQPGGTGITFDARYDTPLANQNITNYPASFPLGYDNACIVKAQDIWRSVLLYRINTNDPAVKMPPLARNLIDTNAVQVFTDWINSLPGTPALPPPIITPDGGMFAPSVTVALQDPNTNATIYYTLDGTLPTTNSFRFSGPLRVTNSLTVTANAFAANFNNSVASSAAFTVPVLYFASVTVTNHQFQLTISGMAGNTYVLQASTDLKNWIPISTNLASANVFILYDTNAGSFPYRFYRVSQQ